MVGIVYSISEETKQKIRVTNLGRIISEETRNKMSQNHADVKGKNNPMYGTSRTGPANPNYGRKKKKETD